MKDKVAMTANLRRFLSALKDLQERAHCEEGMGLLHGHPGQGKTTALAMGVDQLNGVFLRATILWTPHKLLQALSKELNLPRQTSSAEMLDSVIQELTAEQRPLFIDEADYLLRKVELFDLVRDIYDLASVPVILVGMPRFIRKIKEERWARHARRITRVVEFTGLSPDETALVAEELCEISISSNLAQMLHQKTQGNIGHVVTGLRKIEALANANGLDAVGLRDWDGRSFFLGEKGGAG